MLKRTSIAFFWLLIFQPGAAAAGKAGAEVAARLRDSYQFGFQTAQRMLRHPLCAEHLRSMMDAAAREQAVAAAVTAVHECGHAQDDAASDRAGNDAAFVVDEATSFHCPLHVKDASDRPHKVSDLPLSSLLTDRFASLRPRCRASDIAGIGCDWYADTYLDGEIGKQGLDSLLEELTQYLHSLETAAALRSLLADDSRLSAQDSLLTLLWYLERYVAQMRLAHPHLYATVVLEPCWRSLILTLWDRSWAILSKTAGDRRLGLDAAAIATLAQDPALAGEIQRLRQLVTGADRSPASRSRR